VIFFVHVAYGCGSVLLRQGIEIEMTWVGPRYHVLDGGPNPPRGRGKYRGSIAVHL